MSSLAQRLQPLAWLKRLKRGGAAEGEDLPIRDWTGPAGGSQAPRISGFDSALVWCVVALLSLGLVMVYSASVALPDSPKYKLYSPTFFLSRHALSLAHGLRRRAGRGAGADQVLGARTRPGCSSSAWCCWCWC